MLASNPDGATGILVGFGVPMGGLLLIAALCFALYHLLGSALKDQR